MTDSANEPGSALTPNSGRGTASRLWPLVAGALTGVGLRLVFTGVAGQPYNAMMGAFVVFAPMLVGSVTVYLAGREQRRTWAYYFWAAVLANALFVLGTLIVLLEGIICAVLAVPLFGLVGGIAGLVTGAACRWLRAPRRTVYCVAAVPLLLGGLEQHVPLPDAVDVVTSSRTVAASPERVWAQLLYSPRIEPAEMERAWMYRIGVPLPLSAVTEERDGELVRHITMGKGIRFDQVAVDWKPNERIVWTYRFEPDSFPPRALDDHVEIGGSHFDLIDTVYSLEPVAGGTKLTARMRYRVSTRFNWYARPIAALLIRDFESTALAFYAGRAEGSL